MCLIGGKHDFSMHSILTIGDQLWIHHHFDNLAKPYSEHQWHATKTWGVREGQYHTIDHLGEWSLHPFRRWGSPRWAISDGPGSFLLCYGHQSMDQHTYKQDLSSFWMRRSFIPLVWLAAWCFFLFLVRKRQRLWPCASTLCPLRVNKWCHIVRMVRATQRPASLCMFLYQFVRSRPHSWWFLTAIVVHSKVIIQSSYRWRLCRHGLFYLLNRVS